MKIIITGSLGNVSAPLISILTGKNHDVTVVSSDRRKATKIEHLGANAAIGSITDINFLHETFKDADAAFLMTPPMITEVNIIDNTVKVGLNYADAIRNSSIRKIVMLSSVGADFSTENGPIAALHHIEKIYSELKEIAVTVLRAGNFYTNLYNEIPMIKKAGIVGANYGPSDQVPWSHPGDIAKAVAQELVSDSRELLSKYCVSAYLKCSDIAKSLGAEIENPELFWIEFSDDEFLDVMIRGGLPVEMAQLYVEMGAGIRKEIVQNDFIRNNSPITGTTKIQNFAKEFSKKFTH